MVFSSRAVVARPPSRNPAQPTAQPTKKAQPTAQPTAQPRGANAKQRQFALFRQTRTTKTQDFSYLVIIKRFLRHKPHQ